MKYVFSRRFTISITSTARYVRITWKSNEIKHFKRGVTDEMSVNSLWREVEVQSKRGFCLNWKKTFHVYPNGFNNTWAEEQYCKWFKQTDMLHWHGEVLHKSSSPALSMTKIKKNNVTLTTSVCILFLKLYRLST